MNLLKPINPEAVNKSDQFIIAKRRGNNWQAVESWQAKFLAEYWMKSLQKYDPKGRYRIFEAANISYV